MEDQNRTGLENEIRKANPPLFPDLSDVKARLEARAKANIAHTPRQQGPWLVCVSCANQHTIQWVGMDKSLVGINEKGEPVLKPRHF